MRHVRGVRLAAEGGSEPANEPFGFAGQGVNDVELLLGNVTHQSGGVEQSLDFRRRATGVTQKTGKFCIGVAVEAFSDVAITETAAR